MNNIDRQIAEAEQAVDRATLREADARQAARLATLSIVQIWCDALPTHKTAVVFDLIGKQIEDVIVARVLEIPLR